MHFNNTPLPKADFLYKDKMALYAGREWEFNKCMDRGAETLSLADRLKTEGEINQWMCRLNNASLILLRADRKKKWSSEREWGMDREEREGKRCS